MAEWSAFRFLIAHTKAPDLRPGSEITARVRTPLVALICIRSHGLGVYD